MGLRSRVVMLLRGLVPRSIRAELLLAFALLAASPATFVNLYYAARVGALVHRDALQRGQDSVTRVANEIGRLLAQTGSAQQYVMGQIVASPLFTRYDSLSLLQRYEYRSRVWQDFHNLMWVYPFIQGVYVVNWDGEYYTSQSVNDYNHEAFLALSSLSTIVPGKTVVVPPHTAAYALYPQASHGTVSFVRSVNFLGHAGKETYLHIDIDYQEIRDALGSEGTEGPRALLLLDTADRIVGSFPDTPQGGETARFRVIAGAALQAVGGPDRERSGEHIVVEIPLEAHGLRLVGVLSAAPLLAQMGAVRRSTMAISLLMVAFSAFVSITLAGRITRPIKEMVEVMGNVGRGDFSAKLPAHRNTDLQALTSGFNRMVDRVHRLMRDVVEKETERTEAELRALQARINPHFLYNTLEVIRGMALSHGDYPVMEMVEALANFFRYGMTPDGSPVTLAKELEYVRNYVSIQEARHGERFSVSYGVPDELLDAPVPPLILQPIVENAFTHGFRRGRRKGHIVVAAARRTASLLITVRDDGDGIESARLAEIRKGLDAPTSLGGDGKESIGIRNVHRRIRLDCGSRFGLYLSSRSGAGTVVALRLPLTLREL